MKTELINSIHELNGVPETSISKCIDLMNLLDEDTCKSIEVTKLSNGLRLKLNKVGYKLSIDFYRDSFRLKSNSDNVFDRTWESTYSETPMSDLVDEFKFNVITNNYGGNVYNFGSINGGTLTFL